MDTTAQRARDSSRPDLTNIDLESFQRLKLPTRRPLTFPAPPPSSPRHSNLREGAQHGDIDTQCSSLLAHERQTTHTSSECCDSEVSNSREGDSWSQGCSSCSEEDSTIDNRKLHNVERSCGDGLSNGHRKSVNASSAILREPSVSLTNRSLLDLKTTRLSSRLPSQPISRHSNTLLGQPLAYKVPDSPTDTPPPSYSASLILSSPSHTAFQPFAASCPDPNECSFMNFDDSDSEPREKRGSKSGSIVRYFDRKREGQTKNRFRHSISGVFNILSCSR